jgi:FMN-dependent NADH-azoreductase
MSMQLFRLDASINPDGSASRAIGDIVEAEWRSAHPDGTVARRDIGAEPLPADAWPTAVKAAWTPEDALTEHQRESLGLARELAAELRSADAVLATVPLYNFGVAQHAKVWIDLAIAGAEQANEPLLAGKPVVLALVRGGAYGPGTPRDGWDHSTGYLRRIFGDVWGGDLTLIEREFTLVGVNPALDEFKDLAAQLKDQAHSAARDAGRTLATVPAPAA